MLINTVPVPDDCLTFIDFKLFLRLRETLYNCLCFSSSSPNMVDRRGEFSFFQGTHVRIDKRIDIFVSRRPMITKFGNQVHLQGLTQMRLIKQVLVTSLHQHHMTN